MNEKDRPFRTAAVQLSPVLMDRDGTTEKVLESIRRCGEEGIRLAVFPETIIPNYPYFAWLNPPATLAALHQELYEQSVEVPGSVTEALSSAARASGTVVVVGINERDGGSLYNTQLIFDADGTLLGKRRKIMPTFHERMIWGWGDGSGLKVFETSLGRLGALICWEHFMPLARYALIAQGEEIHCSHFPGTMAGESMSRQIDAAIRHHAMESGAFVINATCWLSEAQRAHLSPDETLRKYLRGGLCTAIVAPHGEYLAGPLEEGEGMAVAEINLKNRIRQKAVLDPVGHYSRPDLFRLQVDRTPRKVVDPMSAPSETLPNDPGNLENK